ncbi:hypothetical protein NL431_28740, partial [Klebsiella pneumoniae]|nr:hypothetical protein [Klebsiella pneumoniae]
SSETVEKSIFVASILLHVLCTFNTLILTKFPRHAKNINSKLSKKPARITDRLMFLEQGIL